MGLLLVALIMLAVLGVLQRSTRLRRQHALALLAVPFGLMLLGWIGMFTR